MKKLLSISFSLLILISGMHLSISTHFCGGEIADVKLSFTREKASCGMEDPLSDNSCEKVITTNCCHNEDAVFAVDNNYSPSLLQINDIIKKVSQVYAIPSTLFPNTSTHLLSICTDVSPPDNKIANAVGLADICVFRI
jgi:hypothetical protein